MLALSWIWLHMLLVGVIDEANYIHSHETASHMTTLSCYYGLAQSTLSTVLSFISMLLRGEGFAEVWYGARLTHTGTRSFYLVKSTHTQTHTHTHTKWTKCKELPYM